MYIILIAVKKFNCNKNEHINTLNNALTCHHSSLYDILNVQNNDWY